VTGAGIRLTSPERMLWPRAQFTKGRMLDYYRSIAPVLLRHLAGRPVTLYRAPEGVDGPGWYQTECRGAPSWLRTVEVRGERGAGQRYCVIDDVDGLLWAANLGAIEFHPLSTTLDRLGEPSVLVFDLDPGEDASILDCGRVALTLRERLAAVGLTAVAKTSGSAGLHVVAPLAPGAGFRDTKAFARRFAADLERRTPDLVVARSVRAERRGRVFVDWVANDLVRSIVGPYSLRALPWPLVSTPVAWDELREAVDANAAERLWFMPTAVLDRVERLGDLFAVALGPGAGLPTVDPD
jgi:bifunctional non-homologous end joining protein LigD